MSFLIVFIIFLVLSYISALVLLPSLISISLKKSTFLTSLLIMIADQLNIIININDSLNILDNNYEIDNNQNYDLYIHILNIIYKSSWKYKNNLVISAIYQGNTKIVRCMLHEFYDNHTINDIINKLIKDNYINGLYLLSNIGLRFNSNSLEYAIKIDDPHISSYLFKCVNLISIELTETYFELIERHKMLTKIADKYNYMKIKREFAKNMQNLIIAHSKGKIMADFYENFPPIRLLFGLRP